MSFYFCSVRRSKVNDSKAKKLSAVEPDNRKERERNRKKRKERVERNGDLKERTGEQSQKHYVVSGSLRLAKLNYYHPIGTMTVIKKM